MNGQQAEVRLCDSSDCPLFYYRFGRKEEGAKLTPIKAIKAFCLDCSGFFYAEVRKCELTDCVLYPYRLGNNPGRKGIGRKNSVFTQKLPTELAIS
jgi:hypothetical protein